MVTDLLQAFQVHFFMQLCRSW